MNEIVRPGAGVLFMKVGTHAKESLADIIARKRKEIDAVGHTLWGYGGPTCYPTTMVQPFARIFAERGQPIHLVMEAMESNHFAEPLCAAEASSDGINWFEIPKEIEVRGSRFALKISSLAETDLVLPLQQTVVPVGPSKGRTGSRYVKGKVDKACLQVLEQAELSNEPTEKFERKISLIAELADPYAVFLRKFR